MTSIVAQAGPFAQVPEWHLRRLLAHPAGRRSVVLRTYLRIAVEVSGRRTRDGWYIQGGIRGLASELGADVRDVRAAVQVLHELGIVLRNHRRTRGDRGHHLASSYVLTVLEPSDLPVDNPVDRGGENPPHDRGGENPPHEVGGTVPPTSGEEPEEQEDDDPPVGPPVCGERFGDAPGVGSGSAGDPGVLEPWLSGDEQTRIILAGEKLEVLGVSSAVVAFACAWTRTRIDVLCKAEGSAYDLCPSCGHGSGYRVTVRAAVGACECCGHPMARYARRDVTDGTGRVLGWCLRPAAVLATARGRTREDARRFEVVGERLGLWSASG